ncbi:MAG: hypothetical protein IPK12_14165 [Gemmatimonadetes bacterium]|nr:hypothetical protein [Gemmatimonadota bacterium]
MPPCSPYAPVPQRTVMLPALVGRLFQTLPLRAVPHWWDLRPQEGAGTSVAPARRAGRRR